MRKHYHSNKEHIIIPRNHVFAFCKRYISNVTGTNLPLNLLSTGIVIHSSKLNCSVTGTLVRYQVHNDFIRYISMVTGT